MSSVDVAVEIQIDAEPADIASVMFDPTRDPDWVAAVKTVEIIDPALAPGARVRRAGSVLGREMSWVTSVEAVHFPHVLALRVADGPFTGMVVYEIQRSGAGCRVGIRSVGETATGSVPSAMIEAPLRSALGADLARLKALVEGPGTAGALLRNT